MHTKTDILIPAALAGLLLIAAELVVFGVQSLSEGTADFWRMLWFAGAFLLVLFAAAAKAATSRRDRLFTVSAAVLAASSAGLLVFVDTEIIQHLIAAGCAVLLFSATRSHARFVRGEAVSSARSTLSVFHLAAMFFFFALSAAVHINFSVPPWFLMGVFFLVPFLISVHSFLLARPKKTAEAVSYAAAIGVVFFQLAWFVHFWPFGYLTIAAVLLVVFYALWDLLQSRLEEVFSTKRFFADAAIVAVLGGIVLLSTPWNMAG